MASHVLNSRRKQASRQRIQEAPIQRKESRAEGATRDEKKRAIIQGHADFNEYGERYEWIEKSNSTSTVRHKNSRLKYCIEMTENDFKHFSKKSGHGDSHTAGQHKTSSVVPRKSVFWQHVPESGEDADDEESAWSQCSPRPPSLLGADEEVEPPENVATGKVDNKLLIKLLQPSKIIEDQSPTTDHAEKLYSLQPSVQREVKIRESLSQTPQQILGTKVEKTHSLASAHTRQSVEHSLSAYEQIEKKVRPSQSPSPQIRKQVRHSLSTCAQIGKQVWPSKSSCAQKEEQIEHSQSLRAQIEEHIQPSQSLGPQIGNRIQHSQSAYARKGTKIEHSYSSRVYIENHGDDKDSSVCAQKCAEKRVDYSQSLVCAQIEKKVEQRQSLGNVERIDPNLQARSHKYCRGPLNVTWPDLSCELGCHPDEHRHSDLKIKRLPRDNGARSENWGSYGEPSRQLPRSKYTSPNICSQDSQTQRGDCSRPLELKKMVINDHGDEPSTTITFRGHIPAELLNDIFFGRREYSCSCWPQYDVEHRVECKHLSDHSHVMLRSSLSEQSRISKEVYKLVPTHQLSTPEVSVNYTSKTKRCGERIQRCEQSDEETRNSPSLLATHPDQRRRAPLVRFRSETLNNVGDARRERPHRANSPALRRGSRATGRPVQGRHVVRCTGSNNPKLISSRRDRAVSSSPHLLSENLKPSSIEARSETKLEYNTSKIIVSKVNI